MAQPIITREQIKAYEKALKRTGVDMHPVVVQYHMMAERYWQQRDTMKQAAHNLSHTAKQVEAELEAREDAPMLKNLAGLAQRLSAEQAALWHIAAAALEYRETCRVLGLLPDTDAEAVSYPQTIPNGKS